MKAPFDAAFPTDNEFGIPTLDLAFQADPIQGPFAAWGSIARTSRMHGTWHFYVDDSKFSALWKHPESVAATQCTAAVEPNCSTNEQTPIAKIIFDVYRKRWIARFWQKYDVRILVDLNVSDRALPWNLLGVPKGWKAFATRYSSEGLDVIHRQAEAARHHVGCDITLVVYSGGKHVENECQRNGWLYFANSAGRVPNGNTTAATC